MKNKWYLVASVFQLVIGILAVISFVVLAINGEDMIRWIPTLLLSVAFVVLGIIHIINYKSND